LSGLYSKSSGIKIKLVWAMERKNTLLKTAKAKKAIIQLNEWKNLKELKNV